MGEEPRKEEESLNPSAAEAGPEVKEMPYDGKAICERIEDAVGSMFEQYGINIPEDIANLGRDVNAIADAIFRNRRIDSTAKAKEDLDYRLSQQTISQEAYDFIVTNMA